MLQKFSTNNYWQILEVKKKKKVMSVEANRVQYLINSHGSTSPYIILVYLLQVKIKFRLKFF